MWNPFKRKTAPAADTKAAPKEEKSPAKKESIEERIEREIDSLPGMIKNKLKDPQVKQRFIEHGKRRRGL